ncbi:AAA family ATPase [Fontibacter flavus]|uniref:ATP/GTP-binding protein n=1 Tax=Fontibacter flavus TaxID=654838 RepID=A0ABV6FSZ9_9BACT
MIKIEEFSFGNFWSFKDMQTLNMSAAKIKSKNSRLDLSNLLPVDEDLNLLKSKAIYGANASGKSNVIKALVTFIRIIKESVKEDQALSMIDAFQLSTETEHQPTFFQLVFWTKDIRYRYGFEADSDSIKSEWLFSTPNKREQSLFLRENDQILDINQTHFEEGQKAIDLAGGDGDGQIFRSNSLFLSSLASFGFGKVSKVIVNAIASISIISGLGHRGMYGLAGESLNDNVKKNFILDFLKKADLGIEDLLAIDLKGRDLPEELEDDVKEDLKKELIVVSKRTKFDENLKAIGKSDFAFGFQESEGTRKMFELSPFIYRALKEGNPLVIDEFDARFHPLLTKKIVELFNSDSNHGAQLIFTTHDTNLLSADILRRDQIDFVEKDRYGASHLYTLIEIKGVRNDASFEKDYIQGKYGAIPFLGDFTNMNDFDYAEEDKSYQGH